MFLLEKARPAKQIKILISDRMLHISVEKLGNLTKHAFFFLLSCYPWMVIADPLISEK